ncbi:MAG: DsbC family protein [Gammaproteobacteria bacterium]|nr:DsbC family protein [Gammaproteobacteria bacterium]
MNRYKQKAIKLASAVSVATMVAVSGGYVSFAQADESAEKKQVRAGLQKLIPDGQADSVEPSAVEGLYEVMIGAQVYYVSKDGKYLLTGKMYDIEKKEDITTPKLAKVKIKAIEEVGDANMVIFGPEDYKHTVTVFTDIDCGYCRKLHNEMDQYNNLGIRVRYLMFPRAGIPSPSYDKAVSVWCADDQLEAMTQAKAGKDIEQKYCKNPVKQHYELGKKVGVTGTPALFFDDGELLPGYLPAQRLMAYFKKKEAK